MADSKISALTALTGANVDTAADLLCIVDTSVSTSKKITPDELRTALGIATQAQQETATSVVVNVTPGRQQYHPSAAKAWCLFDGTGAIAASYNVSGVVKNSTGSYTISFTVAFSSANYAMVCSGLDAAVPAVAFFTGRTTGGATVVISNTGGSAFDPSGVSCAFFGDQ
jgi:hypothetical protein